MRILSGTWTKQISAKLATADILTFFQAVVKIKNVS